ncbi:hypothetical protein F5890DRAFT_1442875 [Lentinula detonsa]|uniref:GYF domain-containing protein n=1 Tax=Lentinula detonsa TaxID=2804962 RepID=A0AA38US89_9AGAR|nr:hypothetical protein F5890DRAFT_1442875 [Lentinula detonsa]
MSTTTMHFGPEWMRTKPQPASRMQPPPSPPPTNTSAPTASTYSSLLTSAATIPAGTKDEAHPLRYNKEEMLRIYREGGGKGYLGLEVERWEGVVRETLADPIGLKEMGEAEKKVIGKRLFTTPLNSDLRRRQSTDYLHLNTQNLERPRLNHANTASASGSPLRERFGSLMTRRRDSTDQPPLLPRKLSLSSQAPNNNSRESGMPSPRGRLGHTPGFDGVLNGGDSWVARRRASEGLVPKAPANSARDPGEDHKELEIREEDEEINPDSKPNPDPQLVPKDTTQSTSSVIAMQKPDKIDSGVALDVPGTHSISSSPASTSASIGLPPGIVDLSSIEWSYLDPQGQVQGPFQANVMQKWCDGGFFSDELLMKRTYIDNDWVPMGELKRRVGSTDKVFLTPIPLYGPPGLIRRTDSPFSNTNEGVYHNGPFQPSPVRSLRNSTLDSLNSNYSDSSTSSFGAAGRFGDASPDPTAFGGRAAPQFALAGEMGSRFNGYPLNTGEASPALSGRSGFAVPSNDYRSPGFGNVNPGRANSLDVNTNIGSPATSWTGFDGMANGRGGSIDSSMYQPGYSNAGISSPFGNNNGFQTSSFPTQSHPSLGMGGLAFEQYPPSPSTQFVHTSVIQTNIPDIFDQSQQQQTPARSSQPPVNPSVTSSPWGSHDSHINKRNIPFDATPSKPTTANSQSPWGTGQVPVSRSTSQPNDISPWPTTSKVVSDNWKEEQFIVAEVTSNNLGQHNRQEKQLEENTNEVVAEIIPEPKPVAVAAEAPVAVVVEDPVIAPPPTKSQAKTTSRRAPQNAPAKAAPPEPVLVISDIPESPSVAAASAVPKAWVKEEESKKTATSLRKIQDAEAKKAEARKAADREKERAARAAGQSVPSPLVEDVQPFTASWGLPTSKAGKGSAATPKESVSPTPGVAAAPPVWSTAVAKPADTKKTMKEIQEEEERRKKTAAKETVANVAGRRTYAENTTKPSLVASPSGNAWTTVGPSGKQTPVGATPTRPPATPAAAAATSSASITRVNGAAARPTLAPVTKTPANNAKVDDFPVAPSTEFLKWLAESLKGLNNTVNAEEIMSMLLSFPIDPDPSTSEIISDLIYANTTTLDGRRFAAEFLSRRKADAVARAKAGPGAAAAKTVSIADVVKAQPKPQAQSEWGGFKVVNKKKKGGRT